VWVLYGVLYRVPSLMGWVSVPSPGVPDRLRPLPEGVPDPLPLSSQLSLLIEALCIAHAPVKRAKRDPQRGVNGGSRGWWVTHGNGYQSLIPLYTPLKGVRGIHGSVHGYAPPDPLPVTPLRPNHDTF
jgi:hypothetical protein